MKNAAFVIIVVAILVTGGIGYLYMMENKKTIVTLSHPDGSSIGYVALTRAGFVDINELEDVGNTLREQERDGLRFAGWFTDVSCEQPFYDSKYRKITSDTVIYAGWNDLSYTLTQEKGKSENERSCTFTNTTDGSESTSWVVRDAFKTNNIRPVIGSINSAATPSEYIATVSLLLGMYEVTMITYVNGEKKVLSTTETIDGTITDTVTWEDYTRAKHTITYKFDVSEYVEYAKLNRTRDFRISNIAKHAVYDTPGINSIKDAIMNLETANWDTISEQDRANLIASFVNNGLSKRVDAKAIDRDKNTDWYYYKIPGIHGDNLSVEYYRYPTEALYDRILYGGLGDCDCHAILTAAIAKACGLDSAVLVIINPDEKEGHAVAGIKGEDFIPPAPQGAASFKEVDGYYACETFRSELKLLVGNVQNIYHEYKLDSSGEPILDPSGEKIKTGWKWEAFPVT
jgi:hypothetical protein